MILFKRHFVPAILNGTKTQTRRGGKKRWNVGAVHGCYTGYGQGHFADVEILDVRQEPLSAISEADALAEGFADRDAFLREYMRINAKTAPTLEAPVWVVTFKVREPA